MKPFNELLLHLGEAAERGRSVDARQVLDRLEPIAAEHEALDRFFDRIQDANSEVIGGLELADDVEVAEEPVDKCAEECTPTGPRIIVEGGSWRLVLSSGWGQSNLVCPLHPKKVSVERLSLETSSRNDPSGRPVWDRTSHVFQREQGDVYWRDPGGYASREVRALIDCLLIGGAS